MYKSRFFQSLLRVIDWMSERRQEIYFLLMLVNVLTAIGFGIYMFILYKNTPMFNDPSTVMEHFARPIFIGMFSVVLVLAFGTFLIHLITLIPFRRVKILHMEMEFDAYPQREIEIANQFLYSSTMLHNHLENVRYLLTNNLFQLKQVLQFLSDSYKNNVVEYNDKLTLTIDILERSELESNMEKKLYESIVKQSVVKSRTAYVNRLFTGENILIGVASVTRDSEAIIVVRRGYNTPFDTYDQETIESILGYATILFDTLVMLNLLQENDILGEV